MHPAQRSPFDAPETTLQLLTRDPVSLAFDDPHFGNGLPICLMSLRGFDVVLAYGD